jgi:hypothetical protein
MRPVFCLAFLPFTLAVALIFTPRLAWADKALVLPFTSVSNATSADLERAQASTRDAVRAGGRTLPTDSEALSGQMAVKDGRADTSEEYRAAGRASSSDWTLTGHVEMHGATYRLEVVACQVDTGRVESLAREIDPQQATAQISEMLALLLRPEGISNAEIPWLKNQPPAPPATPPPAPTTQVVAQPPPPPPPPEPPPVRRAYAEDHPFAIGLDTGVLGTLSRPSNARGPDTAWILGGTLAYALDAVPGLELRAGFRSAAAGPESVSGDVGARYAFPVWPTKRVFAGPELALGGFGELGGEKIARFLMRGALVAAVGLGERVQLELSADAMYAPGGSSALLLGGGSLAGLFRF